jgi:hypothetical protein
VMLRPLSLPWRLCCCCCNGGTGRPVSSACMCQLKLLSMACFVQFAPFNACRCDMMR